MCRDDKLYSCSHRQSMLEHLHSRHLDTRLHRVWLDKEVATFPLYNLSGQLVGYQQYRPHASKERKNNPREGRYFTRKKHTVGVWGLESWNLSNTLFIVEGIFDAARLTNKQCSAIALLSSDVDPSTRQWLKIVRQQRQVIAVCDSDNDRLKKHSHTYHCMRGFKDLGEASDTYVKQLIEDLQR